MKINIPYAGPEDKADRCLAAAQAVYEVLPEKMNRPDLIYLITAIIMEFGFNTVEMERTLSDVFESYHFARRSSPDWKPRNPDPDAEVVVFTLDELLATLEGQNVRKS